MAGLLSDYSASDCRMALTFPQSDAE